MKKQILDIFVGCFKRYSVFQREIRSVPERCEKIVASDVQYIEYSKVVEHLVYEKLINTFHTITHKEVLMMSNLVADTCVECVKNNSLLLGHQICLSIYGINTYMHDKFVTKSFKLCGFLNYFYLWYLIKISSCTI